MVDKRKVVVKDSMDEVVVEDGTDSEDLEVVRPDALIAYKE